MRQDIVSSHFCLFSSLPESVLPTSPCCHLGRFVPSNLLGMGVGLYARGPAHLPRGVTNSSHFSCSQHNKVETETREGKKCGKHHVETAAQRLFWALFHDFRSSLEGGGQGRLMSWNEIDTGSEPLFFIFRFSFPPSTASRIYTHSWGPPTDFRLERLISRPFDYEEMVFQQEHEYLTLQIKNAS